MDWLLLIVGILILLAILGVSAQLRTVIEILSKKFGGPDA